MLNTASIISHTPPTVSFCLIQMGECSSEPVVFTDETDGGAEPYEFLWNFNDPGSPDPTSTQQNPEHKFWDFGIGNATHFVNLQVIDGNDCNNNLTWEVTVIRRPNARLEDPDNFPQFTYCENEGTFTLTVNNISSTKPTNTGYTIDWGDTSGLSTYDASFETDHHTYVGQETGDLAFTANGENGCSDEFTYSVRNGTNPDYGIGNSVISGCTPSTVEIEIDGRCI